MRSSLTVVDESHHQERHQTTFSVVHEITVAHPFLALSADLALASGHIALGHQGGIPLAEVIAQILDDGARLGQDHRLVGARGLDFDDWRLAQGVDLLELGGRKLVGATLENLQLILQLEFFQQPQDAVASRLLEPGVASVPRYRFFGNGSIAAYQ